MSFLKTISAVCLLTASFISGNSCCYGMNVPYHGIGGLDGLVQHDAQPAHNVQMDMPYHGIEAFDGLVHHDAQPAAHNVQMDMPHHGIELPFVFGSSSDRHNDQPARNVQMQASDNVLPDPSEVELGRAPTRPQSEVPSREASPDVEPIVLDVEPIASAEGTSNSPIRR